MKAHKSVETQQDTLKQPMKKSQRKLENILKQMKTQHTKTFAQQKQ